MINIVLLLFLWSSCQGEKMCMFIITTCSVYLIFSSIVIGDLGIFRNKNVRSFQMCFTIFKHYSGVLDVRASGDIPHYLISSYWQCNCYINDGLRVGGGCLSNYVPYICFRRYGMSACMKQLSIQVLIRKGKPL